jgi:DNA-directed RNA polymerase alpha subunit
MSASELRRKLNIKPYETSLYETNLNVRVCNRLVAKGIYTIEKLSLLDYKYLRKMKNIGEYSLNEIRRAIHNHLFKVVIEREDTFKVFKQIVKTTDNKADIDRMAQILKLTEREAQIIQNHTK